ncbi:hypothetical protein L218DRAFT_908590 [Marasmius fiardii PR-910]|nr:hypothetical protein L218DRAFT_908590 [Marasmius fiardii PR-910]
MKQEKASPQVSRVLEMTEEEMGQAIELYAQAFSGDIYLNAFLGGDWALLPSQGRAVLRAAMLEGEVYAVKDTYSDRFISIGIWLPPGRGIFATEAQRALGFYDWFDRLSEEAKDWHAQTVPNVKRRLVDPMFTDEEMKTRWWCFGLFTATEHRGKGYAKAIVNEVSQRVSKANEFIGLATVSLINVARYKTMGLQERGTYVLPTLFGDIQVYVLTRKESKDGME